MDGSVVFVTDPARVYGPGRRVETRADTHWLYDCAHCGNVAVVDFFDIALRALVGGI